jgi:isoquinoline 1-oxidoreductase alpha subunit
MEISFQLNGKPTTVDVAPDMPVLWVLRDVLDMKGTKFGCGASLCGACTVLVDGSAQRTCRMPVSRIAGGNLTTIEGLSADGTHPVQLAWQEIDVPQCGYCQAGQIMTATAFLAGNPEPTDEQIDAGMPNLCRCASYTRIRTAVHRAAELQATNNAESGTVRRSAPVAGE